MIREAIIKLSNKENLSYEEAEQVMNEIMEGQASQVQMAAYLTALSIKGENIDEITASAAGMRAHCIKLLHDMDVLEIVGTGGVQTPLISPPPLPWSLRPEECRWQSTETGQHPPKAEPPMCWRRWE